MFTLPLLVSIALTTSEPSKPAAHPPPAYEPVSPELEARANTVPMLVGGGIFVAAYVGTVVSMKANDGPNAGLPWVWVPVVNAFAHTNLVARNDPDDRHPMAVVGAIAQGAGLVLFVYGATTDRVVAVKKPAGASLSMRVVPSFGREPGVAAVGTF